MAQGMKRAALILAVTGLVMTACGGDGTGDEADWIVGLLARMPDTTTSAGYVTVIDLTATAAAAGISIPGPGASEDEMADYLFGLPRDALLPDLLRNSLRFGEVGALTAELGVDPVTVNKAILAGYPPEVYEVLVGSFDAAAIDRVVRAEPVWSDLLTTAEHRGVTYYSWGDDLQSNRDRVTAVRPLGRGGRLGLDDDYLYWAPWTAGIEGLIDAGSGAVPTLADDVALVRVARALADAGVYSAVLTDLPLLQDAAVSALALGAGGGHDEAGPFWVIAALHDGPAAAEAAAAEVERLLVEGETAATRQAWSERISGFEFTVDSGLMVAVVRSAGPVGDWWQAFITRDTIMLAAQG